MKRSDRICMWMVLGCFWLVPGCLEPLDVLGNETIVTEQTEYSKDNQPIDDRIEDKNPVYDPDRQVVETFGECQVTLNKSKTVTKLDVVPLEEEEEKLQDKLFRDRAEAIRQVDALPEADLIPSMETINGHMKPFNDGLYASIEIGLQEGIDGVLQSKRQFLYDLLAELNERLSPASPGQRAHLESAMVFVAATLMAGGNNADLPAGLESQAQDLVDLFMTNRQNSRPIGFYTWDQLLEEVFRQDRFLQNLDAAAPDSQRGMFAAVVVVLEEDNELLDRYQQLLSLYAGLTNPFASYTPVDLMPYIDGLGSLDDVDSIFARFDAEHEEPFVCTQARFALLPASRSKDTELYNSLYCLTPQPPDVNFIEVLIDAIRSGDLDLTPDPDSGWYDYQLWALETLLLPERGPESDHLLLTAAYKQKLLDTFKSIITQNRETHVKQLMGGMGGSEADPIEIEVYPLFPVEPFPTFYLRTARGYRFLEVYLTGVLGTEFMEVANRLHEDGEHSTLSLLQELGDMVRLLYGLYVLSANSVGLDPETHLLADETEEIELQQCAELAVEWLENWRGDEDLLKDPRVIVPISVSDGSDKAVYWAVLGVKVIKISAEFVEGYQPEVVDPGDMCEVTGMVGHNYHMLVEHMEEVRFSGEPPTREEFRDICDRHDNPQDIISELEGQR